MSKVYRMWKGCYIHFCVICNGKMKYEDRKQPQLFSRIAHLKCVKIAKSRNHSMRTYHNKLIVEGFIVNGKPIGNFLPIVYNTVVYG